MWVSKNCEILLLQQLRITEDAKFNYEEYGEKQSKVWNRCSIPANSYHHQKS